MVKNNCLMLIQNKKPVEEVSFWEEKQIKTSPLSQDARKKVVNKSGSNFRNEKEVYGPCLSGDISNCRCSKEELERQKALVELQREKEKLEVERRQRGEEEINRRRFIERKRAKMDVAWKKWEADNKAYLEEQRAKMPWNRDDNWQRGLPKPSSNLDDY